MNQQARLKQISCFNKITEMHYIQTIMCATTL